MIHWLLGFFRIAPRVAPDRRRSLIARLTEPTAPENSTMHRAQAAQERHEVREQVIAAHKVTVAEEQTRCRAERQEHQTEIAEGAVDLEKMRRRIARRTPLVDIREVARKEAQRRREG